MLGSKNEKKKKRLEGITNQKVFSTDRDAKGGGVKKLASHCPKIPSDFNCGQPLTSKAFDQGMVHPTVKITGRRKLKF